MPPLDQKHLGIGGPPPAGEEDRWYLTWAGWRRFFISLTPEQAVLFVKNGTFGTSENFLFDWLENLLTVLGTIATQTVRGIDDALAAGVLFLRAGMDPDADETWPTGAFIFLHPGSGDPYSADGILHLGSGSSEGAWPRGLFHIFVNSPIAWHHFTYADLPASATAGMIQFITDSASAAVGDIETGGGTLPAFLWFTGTDWKVLAI